MIFILFLILRHWPTQATLLITKTAIARPTIESLSTVHLPLPERRVYPFSESQNVMPITFRDGPADDLRMAERGAKIRGDLRET